MLLKSAVNCVKKTQADLKSNESSGSRHQIKANILTDPAAKRRILYSSLLPVCQEASDVQRECSRLKGLSQRTCSCY